MMRNDALFPREDDRQYSRFRDTKSRGTVECTHTHTRTRGIVSRLNEWQRKERIDHEPSIMDEVCGSNFPFG